MVRQLFLLNTGGTVPSLSFLHECRFTKCNYCTLIKNELYNIATSKEQKTKLTELLDQHLKLQV